MKNLDFTVVFIFLTLSTLGLLIIFSTSLSQKNFLNFKKQLFFVFWGLFLMIIFSFIDWRIIKNSKFFLYFLYFVSLILLFLLFLFGKKIRGSKTWYSFSVFSFDPIELLKLVLVLLLAEYFSRWHTEMYHLGHILISGFLIFLPSILIFFQPNLGPVIIIILMWLMILIASGIKLRHFLILLFFGIFLCFLSWKFFLKDYQKERILGFLFPKFFDPFKITWSQNQSKIAIGSGGLFGKGIFNASQTQLGFLPESQTDFVFAALAEEFGFFGVSFLLILLVILVYKILKISFSKNDNFAKLFGIGFSSLIVFESFVNIGMNLGLLPTIGIPLPFVSYGGSSFIFHSIFLGILQSIKLH